MKTIQLTKGQVAIVDDEDYEALSNHKWHCGSSGYACRQAPRDINGRQREIYMHRVLIDTPPGMNTDHINGERLDNRRCNLRVASISQNQMNRRKPTGSFLKLKGVSAHRTYGKLDGKFVAVVTAENKRHYLGIFPSEIAAHAAYAEAARRLHGEFARIA